MAQTLFLQDVMNTPRSLADTLAQVRDQAGVLGASLVESGVRRVVALGNGTSLYASLASIYLHNALAAPGDTAAWAMPTAEFGLYPVPLARNDALIGVSVSGELVDLLDVFDQARGQHRLVAITNVPDSTLTRVANHVLLMKAGASLVPTSTKTYVTSLAALSLLWLALLEAQGATAAVELRAQLMATPDLVSRALDKALGQVAVVADRLANCRRAFVVGAGPAYALAQEVALVLKEVVNLPSEAAQSREMVQGMTSVVDASVGILVINPPGRGQSATRQALAQCVELGATTVEVGGAEADLQLDTPSVTISWCLFSTAPRSSPWPTSWVYGEESIPTTRHGKRHIWSLRGGRQAMQDLCGRSSQQRASAGALGIDLGGSMAKLALVREDACTLAEETVDVPDDPDPSRVLAPIGAAIDRLLERAAFRDLPVVGIGCGVSGFLDASRTRILLNNTAALNGFSLAAWLCERSGLPACLDNDACMAALAACRLGGAPRAGRVLVVTVGTGIGVVLVADGAIVRIHHGETGEAGHVIVDAASTLRCPSGCRGCLETVAAAPAIARAGHLAARQRLSPALASTLDTLGEVTAADVGAAAAEGDVQAGAILRDAGRWLGLGLATWAPLYAPTLILLGGGVAGAGVVWLRAATDSMMEAGWPYFVRAVSVRQAELGSRAGAIGAALAAQDRVSLGVAGHRGEGMNHAPFTP